MPLPRILVLISSSEQACVGTVSALSDETYHLWATVAAGAQQQRARGVLLPKRPLQSRIVARAVGEGAPSRAHGGGERALLGREIIAAGLQLGGGIAFAYTAWASYVLNKYGGRTLVLHRMRAKCVFKLKILRPPLLLCFAF